MTASNPWLRTSWREENVRDTRQFYPAAQKDVTQMRKVAPKGTTFSQESQWSNALGSLGDWGSAIKETFEPFDAE